MGTMRSGHYVAYVQRGLTASDSPQLQSLLHKHSILDAPAATGNSDEPPPALGKGKNSKTDLGQKASSAKASKALTNAKGKGRQANAAAVKDASVSAACDAATAQQEKCDSAQAEMESSNYAASATPFPRATKSNHGDQPQLANKAANTESGSISITQTNGTADSHASVPDDWEHSDSSATDEPQPASALGKPLQQTNGLHVHKSAGNLDFQSVQSEQSSSAQHQTDSIPTSNDVTNAADKRTSLSNAAGNDAESNSQQAQHPENSFVRAGVKATSDTPSLPDKRAWFYISDTQVKPVTEADVLSREAYILLYMRIT